MKKNLWFFIAIGLLSFTILLSGCSNDDNSVNDSDNPLHYFSAKVEGQQWSFSTSFIKVSYKEPIFMEEPASIIIIADCDDGTMKVAFDKDDLRIGTHTLHEMGWHDDLDNGAGLLLIRNNKRVYETALHSTGGTFTITTLTKTELAGTFEFYAQSGFPSGPVSHVTEGIFRVKLPQ